MDLVNLIEEIWRKNEDKYPTKLPQWWLLILKQVEAEYSPSEENTSQWQQLLKNLQKVLQLWQRKLKKWEVISLDTLIAKISKVPVVTSATSYSLQMMNDVIELFTSCANTEDLDEEECLDSLAKMTTSMSSTIAHTQEDTAGTSSGQKLNLLEHLGRLGQQTNPFGNSLEPTGTMSSSISFLEKGEIAKYTLEEKVGKNRLTVSTYIILNLNYILYKIYLTCYNYLDQLVRWQKESDTWGSLVRSEDSWSDLFGERQGNKRISRAASTSSVDEIYGKKPRTSGKFFNIREEAKALLLKYYCSPISSIRDVKEWRDNPMLSDPKNKDYIQASFDDFGKDLNEYTLLNFYNILIKSEPLFMTSMNYGSMEDSLSVIDNLMKHQFDDDEEKIIYFLNSVVDVLNKQLAKTNTIVVHSPPSAGKNYFFDMIFAICLNYGQLGQANKNNTFAFQEAPNKRLLLWNEPNYESCLTDTIKMMLGGDPYTVRVKHSMDTHVKRTPVIVLTNNIVPFMNDIAFKDRIIKFQWKTAPFLKEIDFKPYPMSFFELLNKYNIKF